MLDITTIILSPKIGRAFCRVAVLTLMFAFGGWNFSALAHPGSGIAVDQHGRIYFTDTGQGVWKIEESGRVSLHEGPAFHWLAIDLGDRFAGTSSPAFLDASAQIQKIGSNPTLLLASDFPVTIDREGALYYPEFGGDKRLRVYLHTTSDARREWIPRVRRISADGSSEIIATIERTGASESRAVQTRGVTSKVSFSGPQPGAERNIAGIRLCWCPPGTFRMGSPADEPERRPDEDQVDVTLTQGFWMAKFEATQGEWKRVMGKLPGPLTAQLPEGDDFPVGNVNFAEAELFCRKLSELSWQSGELPKDWEFRLPTEAQWEYACRAGTDTATAFGNKLSSRQANFSGKPYNGAEPGPSLHRAAKVGSYPANAWGLHDMHGNTFEWCRDWYHPTLPGGIDPDLYFVKASSRVRRGGAWTDHGWPCRSAFRLRFEPARRYDHIGFRPVAVQILRTK